MTTPVLPLFEYDVASIARTVQTACAMPDTDYHYAQASTRAVYGLLWGQLRGRVPLPLPIDLRAVVTTASTRYNQGLAAGRGVTLPGDPDGNTPALPPFLGFTLWERQIINRYRQTFA